MKRDVYVFGTSAGFALAVGEYIEHDDRYNLLGYILNREFCDSVEVHGYPLIPFEDAAKTARDFSIVNCIGYSDMLTGREKVTEMIRAAGVSIETYIHPTALVMPNAEIGVGNIVLADAYIGNRVKIGDGNIIAVRSHVEIGSVVGNFNFIGPHSVCLGPVVMGNHCILGGNSTIKNQVTIADYTLISAGAFITTNTKANGAYIQPGAKRVKYVSSRDFVYYMK